MNTSLTAKGRWLVKGYAPVEVSDPDKAIVILAANGFPKSYLRKRRKTITEGMQMPSSMVFEAIKKLRKGPRRDFERLITGGAQLFADEFNALITNQWMDEIWDTFLPPPTFTEEYSNLVVNQGLNDLLDVTLSSATQDGTWFVGLMSSTPTAAAGDTLASHAGWTERTEYDETNRVAWVDAGAASQSITNSASPAVFTINATVTVGGAFLAGVNTGTSGRLYAAGSFSGGNKSLADNDTLTVTASFTAAAA